MVCNWYRVKAGACVKPSRYSDYNINWQLKQKPMQMGLSQISLFLRAIVALH
jgi:hypothetical protein